MPYVKDWLISRIVVSIEFYRHTHQGCPILKLSFEGLLSNTKEMKI